MSRSPRLKTRYSVHAVITDDDGPALLVQGARGSPYAGRYDLVGTVPEAEEAVPEALARSLKAETGTYITAINRIGILSSHFSYEDNGPQQLHHLAVLYEVTLKGAINLENCLWLPIALITSENSTAALVWAAEWVKSRPAMASELAEAV